MATLSVSTDAPTSAAVDVLVIAVSKGADGPVPLAGSEAVDSALDGRLAAVLTDLGAAGDEGEVTRFASLGAVAAPVIAAVGVGELEGEVPSADVLRKVAGTVIRALAGRRSVALSLPSNDPSGLAAAAEGALLASYSVKEPAPGKAPVEEVIVLGGGELPTRAAVLAGCVALARDLGNLPANLLPPEGLADRAVSESAGTGIEVTVLDEVELAAQGFGGILGVGKGSVNPPASGSARLESGGGDQDRRARRQGHHVRFRWTLAEAFGRHGVHEDRHGGAAAVLAPSSPPPGSNFPSPSPDG